MEHTDTSSNSNGELLLKFANYEIGVLGYKNNLWTFYYTEEYKKNRPIAPVIDFSDINKVYKSNELWPLFASRIPALNQPYQFRKIVSA